MAFSTDHLPLWPHFSFLLSTIWPFLERNGDKSNWFLVLLKKSLIDFKFMSQHVPKSHMLGFFYDNYIVAFFTRRPVFFMWPNWLMNISNDNIFFFLNKWETNYLSRIILEIREFYLAQLVKSLIIESESEFNLSLHQKPIGILVW